ncbi:MAG: squalene-hopene cyclase [Planctomycetota bacterium]|nr:MAG: squalene-hopene cyclase [Planctomycetota bacterium]
MANATAATLARLLGGPVRKVPPAPPLPTEELLERELLPEPRPASAARLPRAGRQRLEGALQRATEFLLGLQHPEGYWLGPLESNVQIEAQWILCLRYLGVVDPARERRLVASMRASQRSDGGWALYKDAPASDLSITVQAYFAAKLAGCSPEEPWLARARAFVRSRGGVENSSVITKIYLALFGEYDWEGCPALPISFMLMPPRSPFNIYEISYWARTCVVPLLVLAHKRRIHPTPAQARIPELFVTPRSELRHDWPVRAPLLSWKRFFRTADRALKWFERLNLSLPHQQRALQCAERWLLEHQDADGSWGGIFPAITHSVMALHALGYPVDSGPVARGLQAIRDLEIERDGRFWVQPCASPVWDTAWTVVALGAAGLDRDHPALRRATDWLYERQILRPGDWAIKCPGVEPGGWAFQFHNDFYPDTDDSSVVLMALLHSHYRDDPQRRRSFDRGLKWLLGLQNDDGGWGAFERAVDNPIYDEVPLSDSTCMLDPSEADVSGRCVEVLCRLGYPADHPALARAIRYLRAEQQPDGSWYGRWGVNHIYGTWSVLSGLGAARLEPGHPALARGAAWLRAVQQPDGGWGESCRSYEGGPRGVGPPTASQTAWAVMGLIAAGQAGTEACRRGVQWLLERQRPDGGWEEDEYTGTGFPGIFYLRYHYYPYYFPTLALARYRAALEG